jgi:hypothetical protein
MVVVGAGVEEPGMNMARAWQEHGKSMARTWQEHGTNMPEHSRSTSPLLHTVACRRDPFPRGLMDLAFVAPQGQEITPAIVSSSAAAMQRSGGLPPQRQHVHEAGHNVLNDMRRAGFLPMLTKSTPRSGRTFSSGRRGSLYGRDDDLSKTLTTLPLHYAQDMLGRGHSEQQCEGSLTFPFLSLAERSG